MILNGYGTEMDGTTGVVGTYTKVTTGTGTWTEGFTYPLWEITDNQLKYIGTRPRKALFVAEFSLSVTGTNVVCSTALHKNGTILPDSEVQQYITAADVEMGSCVGLASLEPGDYVEVWNKLDKAGDTVFERLSLTAQGWNDDTT
jgi:hypothetical protein